MLANVARVLDEWVCSCSLSRFGARLRFQTSAENAYRVSIRSIGSRTPAEDALYAGRANGVLTWQRVVWRISQRRISYQAGGQRRGRGIFRTAEWLCQVTTVSVRGRIAGVCIVQHASSADKSIAATALRNGETGSG